MGKVHVNVPNTKPGKNVVIPGLGSFVNGETKEVDGALLERFLQLRPSFANALDGDTYVVPTGGQAVAQKQEEEEEDSEPELSVVTPFSTEDQED